MYISIGAIILTYLFGLYLAYLNITDEEGYQRRIEARRKSRKPKRKINFDKDK